jgi:glycosyltransferase involved in cell wall biosynthesis
MVDLTIYIPTYNRLSKIKNCLRAIRYDLKGYEDRVKIFVSNNGSTDGTKEYLDAQKWIEVRHNTENLGAAANFIYAYNLPFDSKFVWIIGDDDYVIPGTIGDLLKKTKYDVDFIFCNTMAFSPEDEQRIWESYPEVPEGAIKGKYPGEIDTTFEKLIDPNVADTLLGELMVICFRQSAVRWSQSLKHHEEFENEGRHSQAHNVPLIECFDKNTKALYVQTPRTFNFWGTAEWLGNYDYVFPVIILWLIKRYRKFISEQKYKELLGYYFSLMGSSLHRQFNKTSTAKPFSKGIQAVIVDSFKEYQDA